ncbi:MAG: sulfatase-like hydrolase/transferase, partial [Pseudomonadota bacterium]
WRPVAAIDRAHEVRRIMQSGGIERVSGMPVDLSAFNYAVTDYDHADYSTGLIAGQTVRFLEAHRDQPFAAWISIPDPHTPYEAARHYFDKIMETGVEIPPWRADEFEDAPERNQILHRMIGIDHIDREHVIAVIAAYHAMVAFIDDAIAEIMAAMDRLDLWRNTIIVFCSDHGDFAGEHMMTAKGGAFHDCLTRVPLIMAGPGIERQGHRETALVSLIDLMPTLLHLQGLDIPEAMMGRLLPGVTDEPAREAICAEYGVGGPRFRIADLEAQKASTGRAAIAESLQWREAEGLRKMVRTDRWKWVHDPLGDRDELYDLKSDPHELTNRAGSAELAPVIAEMREHLLHWSLLTEPHRVAPREAGLA